MPKSPPKPTPNTSELGVNDSSCHPAGSVGDSPGSHAIWKRSCALGFASPRDDEKVALALSGGPDSMALLLMLRETYPKLHALTVDHRLRPESASEAQQVASWCKALGVPHTTLIWKHENITSGIPGKARDARYALMSEWCGEHNIHHLFTAHHLDDQIETIMFRLLRGSGLVGLSGMLTATQRGLLTLHRPLLSTPKSQLIALLKKANQPWLEDASNQNMNFTRNALRAHLQTLTEEQKKRFDVVAQRFARFRAGLEERVSTALAECFTGGQLRHGMFIRQPQELKTRILHHICNVVSGNGEPVRSEKIARLLAAIESGKGKHMLHGVTFCYQPKLDMWQLSKNNT